MSTITYAAWASQGKTKAAGPPMRRSFLLDDGGGIYNVL
jgi:hypothetical protein